MAMGNGGRGRWKTCSMVCRILPREGSVSTKIGVLVEVVSIRNGRGKYWKMYFLLLSGLGEENT